MEKIMVDRFDRSIRFFGKEGQDLLKAAHVAIVGIGGLGTHVVQQLALLGVGEITLIDQEDLDTTNLNRYIGVRYSDPIPGTKKVMIGERLIKEINPSIRVNQIPFSLISKQAFNAIIMSDYVFGCVDREGLRLVLNELCAAYSKKYFDLASEIIPAENPSFGGRLCISWDNQGCLFCFDEIDIKEAQADLISINEGENREAIYGVKRSNLNQIGPSVVSINGILASLAVTEFMLGVTGMRIPIALSFYHGDSGKVTVSAKKPNPNCYYCNGIRGLEYKADAHRYLNVDLNFI